MKLIRKRRDDMKVHSRISCKFCGWTTVKAFKNKTGKFKGIDTSHQRLMDHVESKHPAEYEHLQELMRDRYSESEAP